MGDKVTTSPLIVHVIFSLGIGGLENGLVNLINHMPRARYRHAIVCLQGYTDFAQRLHDKDVQIVALNKQEGKDWGLYWRLARALRQLQPDIVHTRNLAGLEGQVVAAWAVPARRVHGEHGRDVFDVAGRNFKYNLLRRLIRPWVQRYIAVSRDLEQWLIGTIGADLARVTQIYNGVDTEKFRPRQAEDIAPLWPSGFAAKEQFVIGSVGRMAAIKDHPTLVRAFIEMMRRAPSLRARARLLIVGDGPTRATCEHLLSEAGLTECAWLTGERNDVAELMRAMDIFVLPSLGEGISNTILEAMATSLPVLATRVGGNPELVEDGVIGRLVPAADPVAMAQALLDYVDNPETGRCQGQAGRALVERRFSLAAMVGAYMQVYDDVLNPPVSAT